MPRKLFFILIAMLVLAACNPTPTPTSTPASTSLSAPTSNASLANPASVLCEQSGGQVDIRTDAAGAQNGYCVFPDASECEEWALFRGECKAGDSLNPTQEVEDLPNPASIFCGQNGGVAQIIDEPNLSETGVCFFPDGSECEEWAFFRGECQSGDNLVAEDGWMVYRNRELGYSFHYPLDCLLSTAGTLENTLTVTGPLADNINWPVIYFNHPQGQAEYAPPLDADLEQWLKENNLLVDERLEDTQIAGATAIHLHHPRSDQSPASDTFFFAHNGQLYSVVFLHTGDVEDWDFYNHFLENIQFDQ